MVGGYARSHPDHLTACCLDVQVLQHLDEEGNARVCSLLRGMHQDTVLIVGQADSYVAHAFDAVDVVVKQDGHSHLQIAA